MLAALDLSTCSKGKEEVETTQKQENVSVLGIECEVSMTMCTMTYRWLIISVSWTLGRTAVVRTHEEPPASKSGIVGATFDNARVVTPTSRSNHPFIFLVVQAVTACFYWFVVLITARGSVAWLGGSHAYNKKHLLATFIYTYMEQHKN